MNNKNKSVFLDRDGVINKNRNDYVKKTDELEFLPNIEKPIKKLNDAGFLVIIITNQSAINRGLMSISDFHEINKKIKHHLKIYDAHYDDLYFCPHTPTENCFCRKPNPGLLLQAIKDHNIDPTQSWMIGDRDSDMVSGIEAGCRTILIQPNFDLSKAVELILKTDSNK